MENGAKEKRPPSPYIAWKTFTSFLGNMKGKLPPRIDNSVLMNMSGSSRSQLLSALRFLNLIDTNGTVTDTLRELSSAYNTADWKKILATFIQRSYVTIVADLDVGVATPAMLRERFKTHGGLEGSTVDAAIRFFISGLKEAGLPVSPHLSVRAPRGSGTRKRTGGGGRAIESDDMGNEAEPPEGTFRVSFDVLDVAGAAFLPNDIDGKQWSAVSDYVAMIIGLRERARKV
jgi:Family of unknown function (DUF5343)